MPLRTFSDSEMRIIQEVINRVRNSAVGRPTVDSPIRPIGQSADCHVALPKAVIPALSRAPGTGTGTGTGESVEPSEDDEPGYGLCDIYAIQPNDAESGGGTGTGTGENPPNFSLVYEDQLVYNLSLEDIEKEWQVVCKTKFGEWVFVNSATGTSGVDRDRSVILGFLAEDLAAPESAMVSGTQADVNVYKPDPFNGTLVDTGEVIRANNWDPDLTGVEGAYCQVSYYLADDGVTSALVFSYVSCNNAFGTGTGSV